MDILVSGAHHLEQATTLYSCHGVFTDRSIFILNLPRNLKLGDQSQAHTKFLTDVITGREKPKMAERGEESSDGFSSSSVDSCEEKIERELKHSTYFFISKGPPEAAAAPPY